MVKSVQEPLIDGLIGIWQENDVVKSLPVQGRSMHPLIKDGDDLYIKFCKPQSIKVGDIVAFRRRKSTIVHRIIRKTGGGFLEKGDLQLRAELIKTERIMGKVVVGPAGKVYSRANSLLTLLGYIIHRLSRVRFLAKPLLLIPFTINAGTRIITKLRQDEVQS